MKVFISHALKDKDIAFSFSRILHNHKISTSYDQAYSLNEPALNAFRIVDNLRSSLDSSDAIVAILSKNSFSSMWVRQEIDEALFNEKFKDKFFPVLLSNDSRDLSKLPWVLQKINHLILSPDEPANIIGEKIAKEFLKFIRQER